MRSVLNATEDFPERAIQEMTLDVEEELIRTVPVDTGFMRDSITGVSHGNKGSVQTHTAEKPDSDGYAKAVDLGKRAVRIFAKGKANGGSDFLRFEIDGKTFFRRSVFVPAQSGQHFRAKTLQNVKPKLADTIARVWNELI